jgi:hypothetical protein
MPGLAGMGSGPIPAGGAAPSGMPNPASSSGAMPAMVSGQMPAMPGDPTMMPQPLPQQFSHLSGQFPMQPGATPSGMGAVMMYPPGQQPFGNGYPMMPSAMQSGAFPQGQPTATGRLRALEVDEIPPHYRIKREGPRWFVLLGIALTAVATAASVTFLVLRANRQQAIASAALRLESFPPGAVVTVDGNRLADPTPLVYRQVRPSGRYKLLLELPRHKSYTQEVSIPSTGGEIAITPTLQPITGRLRIITEPPGADVFINSLPRGKTPVTITDLDMDNVKAIDVRHPRCDPYRQDLTWPESGNIDLDLKLTPVASR